MGNAFPAPGVAPVPGPAIGADHLAASECDTPLRAASPISIRTALPHAYSAWGWTLGAVIVAGYFGLGYAATRRARRGARVAQGSEMWGEICAEAGLSREVQFLESDRCVVPVTWGWRRPVILVPTCAASWPAGLRRNVLLHELAHVRRADWLFQFLVNAACALYWWNPLDLGSGAGSWRAASEEVCDAFVTERGARPSDYARDLLSIARTMPRADGHIFAVCAMASDAPLDHRIRSILDGSGQRKPVSFGLRVALAIGVVTLCALVAGTTLTRAHVAEPALAGVVIPKLEFDDLTAPEAIEALRTAGLGVLPPETDFSITYRGSDQPSSRGSLHLEECPLPDVLEALAGVFHLSLEYTATGVILSEKAPGLNALHASAGIPPHLEAAGTDAAPAGTGSSRVVSPSPTADGTRGYLNNKAIAADATASLGEVIPSTAYQGKPSPAFTPIEIKADHTWYENGVASVQGHASLTQGNDKLVADTIRYTSETQRPRWDREFLICSGCARRSAASERVAQSRLIWKRVT